MAEVIHTRQGVGAPTSAPDSIHQHYIDTSDPQYIYFAKGTASVADWVKVATGDRPVLPEVPTKASSAEITEGTNDTKFTTPAGLKAAGIVPGGDGGGGAALSIGQVVVTIGEITDPDMIEVTTGAAIDITGRSYAEDLLEPSADYAHPIYSMESGFTEIVYVSFWNNVVLVYGAREASRELYISTDSAKTWTLVPAPANHTWSYLGATNRGGNGDYLVAVAIGSTGRTQFHFYNLQGSTWSAPMAGPEDEDLAYDGIIALSGDADALVLVSSSNIYMNAYYEYDGDVDGEQWQILNLTTEFPEHSSDRLVEVTRYQSGNYFLGVSDGTILSLSYSGNLSKVAVSGGPTSMSSMHFDVSNNVLLVVGDSSIRPMWTTSTWSMPFNDWQQITAADGNTISPRAVILGYDGFRLFAYDQPLYVLGPYDSTYATKGIMPILDNIGAPSRVAGTDASYSTYLNVTGPDWETYLLVDAYVEGRMGIPKYTVPEGYRAYMYLPTDS